MAPKRRRTPPITRRRSRRRVGPTSTRAASLNCVRRRAVPDRSRRRCHRGRRQRGHRAPALREQSDALPRDAEERPARGGAAAHRTRAHERRLLAGARRLPPARRNERGVPRPRLELLQSRTVYALPALADAVEQRVADARDEARVRRASRKLIDLLDLAERFRWRSSPRAPRALCSSVDPESERAQRRSRRSSPTGRRPRRPAANAGGITSRRVRRRREGVLRRGQPDVRRAATSSRTGGAARCGGSTRAATRRRPGVMSPGNKGTIDCPHQPQPHAAAAAAGRVRRAARRSTTRRGQPDVLRATRPRTARRARCWGA